MPYFYPYVWPTCQSVFFNNSVCWMKERGHQTLGTCMNLSEVRRRIIHADADLHRSRVDRDEVWAPRRQPRT